MTHPTINSGSAKRLEGKIYVITFFVSETPWELNEKMELFKHVRDAESWLEWKAKEYGKTVRFVNGVHGLFEPFEVEIVPDYDSGNPQSDLAKRYLEKAGCPAGVTYPEWVKKNSGCDQSLVFIIANKAGRGYANPICWESDGPEGTVLFHSVERPLETGSIIHEFLHLFGAVDLYETPDQTKENSDRMEKMYPKEVMHNHYFPLRELQISPLTAWLVGLSDKEEPWFESFLLSP